MIIVTDSGHFVSSDEFTAKSPHENRPPVGFVTEPDQRSRGEQRLAAGAIAETEIRERNTRKLSSPNPRLEQSPGLCCRFGVLGAHNRPAFIQFAG